MISTGTGESCKGNEVSAFVNRLIEREVPDNIHIAKLQSNGDGTRVLRDAQEATFIIRRLEFLPHDLENYPIFGYSRKYKDNTRLSVSDLVSMLDRVYCCANTPKNVWVVKSARKHTISYKLHFDYD